MLLDAKNPKYKEYMMKYIRLLPEYDENIKVDKVTYDKKNDKLIEPQKK